MNEKTNQLLQQLAEKMGTTVEYLWTILINQAKYDIIISVIQMIFMAAFIFITIKLHIKFSKPFSNDGKFKYYTNLYSEKEELLIIPMILAGIASVIMIIFFLSGFNDLISAIFNPEYWALRQIIQFVK